MQRVLLTATLSVMVWLIFESIPVPIRAQQSGQEPATGTKKKVYTNEDLEKTRGMQNSPTPKEKTLAEKPGTRTGKDGVEKMDLENYRDRHGRGREYWEKRSHALRDKMDEVTQEIIELESRRKGMTGTQSIRLSRSGKTTGSNDLQKIDKRLDSLRREKDHLNRQTMELEDEARRDEALPEWLR
jgi:hypothetical protein